jgi:uncharacterized damage-inducible protein DinB
MTSKEDYIDLFYYTIWANDAAFKSIVATEDIHEQTVRLFSHITAASKVWLNRVQYKGDNPIEPWHLYPLEHLEVISRQISEDWINFLENSQEEKLNEAITYVSSKGDKFQNIVRDIVIQVVNHATYHRAQIAALVRASGGTPALTDYIFYKRDLNK